MYNKKVIISAVDAMLYSEIQYIVLMDNDIIFGIMYTEWISLLLNWQ